MLINTLLRAIIYLDFGATVLDWIDLLNARTQTLNFNPRETVNWQEIESICHDLHEYLPSKQNQCPYRIDVLGWSNPQLRNSIFSMTIPPDDWGNEQNYKESNPQTLAPVLFCLSGDTTRTTRTEIGMAGFFIVLAGVNLGYKTGFCGCINDGKKIAEYLGHRDLETVLIIGIGKQDCRGHPEAVNPITGELIDKPKNFDQPKPPMSSYIKINC